MALPVLREQEDRLSKLSDDILICILSHVDTKLVVQCSILSKRWVSVWTLLPVLNFDSSRFAYDRKCTIHYGLYYKSSFNKFIDKVLGNHNGSVMIDSINVKVTNDLTMDRVFCYVLKHGVRNLSIETSQKLREYSPIKCPQSSDSLMSWSIKGKLTFYMLPTFVGLVTLRLESVMIVKPEPLSFFPNLENLFLVNCKTAPYTSVVKLIGFRLSRLTISSSFDGHLIPYPKKLVLQTPKLALLELDGIVPMSLGVFEMVPILDTVYIDCRCSPDPRYVQLSKHNLINILRCLGKAKYVHISSSSIELLSLPPSTLVDEQYPFKNLKMLNLIPWPDKRVDEDYSSVVAYLLGDNPRDIVKAFPR